MAKKAAKKSAGKARKKAASAPTKKKSAKRSSGKSTKKSISKKAGSSPGSESRAQSSSSSANPGLIIVDAHAMAYRAYYALQNQNLTHPVTGQPTSAIFGFLRMFFKLLIDYSPERVAIVWDPPGGHSFRNEQFSDYKATRKPMPDELRFQIDEIKELLKKSEMPVIEIAGFEADDVIGALAKRFGDKTRVLIVSGDKDCYQLLNENVQMMRGAKGVSDFTTIDPAWVETELGVTVEQIPDYMALVGDSSDNIPGAKGIGPKSAAKLIQEYGSLDEVYKNLDDISPKGTQQKLRDSREDVFLSRELATIVTDIKDLKTLKGDQLTTPDFLSNDVMQLFRQEGYTAVYEELRKAREKREGETPQVGGGSIADRDDTKYELILGVAELKAALSEIKKDLKKGKGILCLDTETDHEEALRARLVGISLCARAGRAFYISVPPDGSEYPGIDWQDVHAEFAPFFEEATPAIVGQNIKYDWIVLGRKGLELPEIHFDTMIASYLSNPNVRRHNLDDMALDYLGLDTIKYSDVVGSGRNKKTMADIPPADIRDYACEDADITMRLYKELSKRLANRDLEHVNSEIEVALIPVLGRMERAGVAIDTEYFEKLSKDYTNKIKKLEKQIFDDVGYEFNVNSTRELQKVLFEDLGLPTGKKTKTGYSTDQKVLEELRNLHPVVQALLDHRKHTKLKGTYIDALPVLVNPETGRIHTSFNQTIAATGRLSSVDPNLQNIPIREDLGRAIRRGFIPSEGRVLLSLDYSQIELRIMAHYSNDEALTESFVRDDIDIHARTAGTLFDVPEDQVSADMRGRGKTVNFAIIYGVTEFGLARNLGIPRSEARMYIERFFQRYPGVRAYMDETIAFAEENGYVQTLSGRVRQIPDIKSSNRFRREGAQRTAINTPIQGTSADVIKLAMIQIDREMQKKKLESTMILQVHDELLFDVVPDEKDAILGIARPCMENAMELRVPLTVGHSFGANWDEAH